MTSSWPARELRALLPHALLEVHMDSAVFSETYLMDGPFGTNSMEESILNKPVGDLIF